MELLILKYLSIIIIILFIHNLKSNFSNFEMSLYDIAYKLGINYLKVVNYQSINNAAVMFDIDDTLLKVPNNPNGNFEPIILIIKLLNDCRKRGIIIIIITARDSIYINQTIQDLNDFKIKYNYLYLRKSPQDDNIMFKSNVKKNLFYNSGINIIMSVGDNQIDIIGEFSGYGIKLPNKQNPLLYHTNAGVLENIVP